MVDAGWRRSCEGDTKKHAFRETIVLRRRQCREGVNVLKAKVPRRRRCCDNVVRAGGEGLSRARVLPEPQCYEKNRCVVKQKC